jgi:hypothetical protein
MVREQEEVAPMVMRAMKHTQICCTIDRAAEEAAVQSEQQTKEPRVGRGTGTNKRPKRVL